MSLNRAPKGGLIIQGVFYKGGQFLPSFEPQRGRWNTTKQTNKKARKVQYAPYKWDYAPIGQKPVFSVLNGRFPYDHKTDTFSMPNDQIRLYHHWTIDFCQYYIDKYNNRDYWEKA